MVTDERHAGRHRRVAEYVIRMFVRVDHVADRLVGDAADGQQADVARRRRCRRCRPGRRRPADDDAEIGDVAGVVGRRQRDLAEMHVVAVRDLLDGKRQRSAGSGGGTRSRTAPQQRTWRRPGHRAAGKSDTRATRCSRSRDLPASPYGIWLPLASGFDGCSQLGGRAFGSVRHARVGLTRLANRSVACRAYAAGASLLPSKLNALAGHAVEAARRERAQYREEPMRHASAGVWLTAGALLSSQLTIATATAQSARERRPGQDAGQCGQRGHADDHLRQSALLQAQSDHRTECRQAAGGVDVLDRRAARPRGRAAGHRRRHVCACAVPQHRLCARPEQRRQDPVEIRAEAGSRTSFR